MTGGYEHGLTANVGKAFHAIGVDEQDITLLSLITPDLKRAHALVDALNLAQLESTTEASILHKLRQGVRETTSTHVVDHGDRVLDAKSNAGVDDHLGASLHFRIATLDTVEIKIGVTLARVIARSGTTAQTNEHSGATENNDVGAFLDVGWVLESMLLPDGTDTTSNHDGLVVTAELTLRLGVIGCKKGAESTSKARTAKLVVEAGTTNGSFQHDIQSAGIVSRAADVNLPRSSVVGNMKVRDPEAAKTSLGHGASANSTLITDLATRTSSGTGEGRNSSRMVMCFDLGQDVNQFLVQLPRTSRVVGGPEVDVVTLHDSSIVAVSRDSEVGGDLVGVSDHLKEALALGEAINGPVGIKLLVTAVLGVDLSKHEELNIVRGTTELGELVDQVLDLGLVKRQATLFVVFLEDLDRVLAGGEDVDDFQSLGLALGKHGDQVGGIGREGLGHAIMENIAEGDVLVVEGLVKLDVDETATLNAMNLLLVATDLGNAGGLGAPWREVARSHIPLAAVANVCKAGGGLVGRKREKLGELLLGGIGIASDVRIIDPDARDRRDLDGGGLVDQLLQLDGLGDRIAGAARKSKKLHCWMEGEAQRRKIPKRYVGIWVDEVGELDV